MPRYEKTGERVTPTPFLTQKQRPLLDPTARAGRPPDGETVRRRALGSSGAVSG